MYIIWYFGSIPSPRSAPPKQKFKYCEFIYLFFLKNRAVKWVPVKEVRSLTSFWDPRVCVVYPKEIKILIFPRFWVWKWHHSYFLLTFKPKNWNELKIYTFLKVSRENKQVVNINKQIYHKESTKNYIYVITTDTYNTKKYLSFVFISLS